METFYHTTFDTTFVVCIDALEALPAWLGELTGMVELRVGGWRDIEAKKAHSCPLRELPQGMLARLTNSYYM